MSTTRDIIIIGGGHNGLVTAFYLARAGLKPLVLERRHQVGGAAITEEFHPGFRTSLLAHSASVRGDILRDMQLEKRGLKLISPEVAVSSLTLEGRALVLYRDLKRAAQEIAKFSKSDSARYLDFSSTLAKTSRVISKALAMTPPEISQPTKADLFGLLQLGRSVRGLGKKVTYDLLRWGPMAVADLASEFFEDELLRATIAARGIFGTFMGPWSAGTSLVLLLRAAADSNPAGVNYFAEGGIGAITRAMAEAAEEAGAEIRTGVEVAQIKIAGNGATGVALATGEELAARAVISNADPKTTFLKLTDPSLLSPTFTKRLQNYRTHGTVAKINLALSALPDFTALSGNSKALKGRIQIGPEMDYLEHAFDESKYGAFSRSPYLEIAIPSLTDSSVAPPGKHVMSIYMQYAPYKLKNGTWDDQRSLLGASVIKTIAQYAPDLPDRVLHTQVITPVELEQRYGLTGGHIFHGELALDQIFTMRPFLDWARYRTPIRNLYLCGSGTHPGVGLTGGSGANAAREILKEMK